MDNHSQFEKAETCPDCGEPVTVLVDLWDYGVDKRPAFSVAYRGKCEYCGRDLTDSHQQTFKRTKSKHALQFSQDARFYKENGETA